MAYTIIWGACDDCGGTGWTDTLCSNCDGRGERVVDVTYEAGAGWAVGDLDGLRTHLLSRALYEQLHGEACGHEHAAWLYWVYADAMARQLADGGSFASFAEWERTMRLVAYAALARRRRIEQLAGAASR